MRVGVVAYRFDYYPYVRNIVNVIPGNEYIKTKDLFSRLNGGVQRINQLSRHRLISTFDLNNQFYDFNQNQVDLLHFFNGISYGRVPWLSTFETILPRLRIALKVYQGSSPGITDQWKLNLALEAIAGEHCKQVIAISACSAGIQHRFLEAFRPYKEAISSKMIILHPPQVPLVGNFDDKPIDLDGQVRFMLVGDSFFRKGGVEVIETLKRLRDSCHYDIGLTLIGNFQDDGYAVPLDQESINKVNAFLEENQQWIIRYTHLPNSELLEMMKRTHIGLLPTYADTYGYSVLEFQAAGCPVITTNVRALPEINNNETGWVIEVPTDEVGEAIYSTSEGRQAISQAIRSGLEKAVHEIFNDRMLIRQKANQSILHIKSKHSPEEFSTKLNVVYQKALNY